MTQRWPALSDVTQDSGQQAGFGLLQTQGYGKS